jgi:cytochrome c oxidase subunit I+III
MPETANTAPPPEVPEDFYRLWKGPSGWGEWFAVVNNQPLGQRFMITALIFFALGGVEALLMRVQLSVSENDFLGPDVYNQLFTMHGSTMMFLFAVPFLEGLSLYLLPLMLGSRDVAFPRLTAFSYWTYLFGGILFYGGFFIGTVPDAGWFSYTPLSGPRYSHLGVDFWLLGLSLVEIAGITAGIEIVVTILKLRAPGMSINRLPLFAWAMLVSGVMILFAFTVLLTGTVMLELDRTLFTRFFDPEMGGNSLLWQHLFWFFGHPEVYIIFLPATGIVSMVAAAYARRLTGYSLIAVAMVLTGFLSFGLWVHHMYATGLPELSMHFFGAASLMIGLASGVQVFAWIATLWGRRPRLQTPLLYVLGFLVLFVIGGFTGVMVAVVSFDWQVHDTYFIVAHFHYVLIGGAVFPILAGLNFWLPKITGRMMNEMVGKLSFSLAFIGFNVAFFPMHVMGFYGLPRRVYTYPAELGLDAHNIVSTAGAFTLAAGVGLFALNFLWSLRRGKPAPANPWGGDSLEWTVPSPPPIYSFLRPPVVYSRHPGWERPERRQPVNEAGERAADALDGLPGDWRATLATDPLHARPMSIQALSGPSYAPIGAAIGLLVGSISIIAQSYLLALAGLVFFVGCVVAWLWPDDSMLARMERSDLPERAGLPIFTTGHHSTDWWGMVTLLTTIGVSFTALAYSYFYIRMHSPMWPQGGLPRPEVLLPALVFGLLPAAGAAQFLASRAFQAGGGRRSLCRLGQWGTLVLGLLFLAGHLYLHTRVPFAPQDNAYASLFFVIGWALDLVAGVGLLLVGAAQVRLYDEEAVERPFMAVQMEVTSLFVLAVLGAAVFGMLHLSPHF